MADCGAGALALASMATVASGLTQLEAGQLAVARSVVHLKSTLVLIGVLVHFNFHTVPDLGHYIMFSAPSLLRLKCLTYLFNMLHVCQAWRFSSFSIFYYLLTLEKEGRERKRFFLVG